MTYGTIADMVDSTSLARREHAAVAKEGIDPPEAWVFDHRWKLASSPGWDAAWDSALASHPDDGDPTTPPYDPGDDEGVITDGMILSAVQKLIEDEKPPILVVPGQVLDFPHTHPKVQAEPQTPWHEVEAASFTDGWWQWDGGAWVVWSPPPIVATPGSDNTALSTDPRVVADPQTPWADDEFAIFGDGQFTWDGDSWEPYVAVQLPPQITALEPDTASITDADFEGHIRGLNFTEDSVIIWNGAEEPTRFVDSTDIWTMVVPSVVTAPTVLDVYVVDNGQASGIVPFTWTA